MPPPLSQYMRDDLKIGIFTPTESSQKRLLTCITNGCSHTSANALILPEHVQAAKQESLLIEQFMIEMTLLGWLWRVPHLPLSEMSAKNWLFRRIKPCQTRISSPSQKFACLESSNGRQNCWCHVVCSKTFPHLFAEACKAHNRFWRRLWSAFWLEAKKKQQHFMLQNNVSKCSDSPWTRSVGQTIVIQQSVVENTFLGWLWMVPHLSLSEMSQKLLI